MTVWPARMRCVVSTARSRTGAVNRNAWPLGKDFPSGCGAQARDRSTTAGQPARRCLTGSGWPCSSAETLQRLSRFRCPSRCRKAWRSAITVSRPTSRQMPSRARYSWEAGGWTVSSWSGGAVQTTGGGDWWTTAGRGPDASAKSRISLSSGPIRAAREPLQPRSHKNPFSCRFSERRRGALNNHFERCYLEPVPYRRRPLTAAEGWRVPVANEWQTIKKARFGVRIWPSYLLGLVGDTGIEPVTSTVSR